MKCHFVLKLEHIRRFRKYQPERRRLQSPWTSLYRIHISSFWWNLSYLNGASFKRIKLQRHGLDISPNSAIQCAARWCALACGYLMKRTWRPIVEPRYSRTNVIPLRSWWRRFTETRVTSAANPLILLCSYPFPPCWPWSWFCAWC